MNRENAVAVGFCVVASAVTISMLSVLACSYGIIDLPFCKSLIAKPFREVKPLTDSGARIRATDKIITSDLSPRLMPKAAQVIFQETAQETTTKPENPLPSRPVSMLRSFVDHLRYGRDS